VLDEPRTDRVRDAFAELTEAVDPFLRPPGVESVRATVRRRRRRRLGAGAAAAVAVAAVVGLVRLPAMEQPAPVVAERPEPVRTLPPTAASPPLAPPAASPTPAGGTSPARSSSAARTPAPDRSDRDRATNRPAEPAQEQPACVSTVNATANGGDVVIAADSICPGETIAVSWVTYEARRDGSQRLFATERLTLTEARPRVTATLRESPTCVGPWYVLRGDPPIRSTIAADEAEPYAEEFVVARADGEICLG
jgi:hypothetical protein